MAGLIHPTAVVEDGAKLGEGVRIGPFCHIGAEVTLGPDVELISQVTILGATALGAGCRVFPQATLGCEPQNEKHRGGRTTLEIGAGCIIREGVTMHVGSDESRGRTTVGDHCNFLAYSHVAHDCALGDHVTMTNGSVLAGHCEVGDQAIIGGLSAVHQYARIGHHAFLGGMSGLEGDLIPWGMAVGNRARLRGLNAVGMRRAGIAREDIKILREAYRIIFDTDQPLAQNLERAANAFAGVALVEDIIAFMTGGKRALCLPQRGGETAGDG